MVTLPKASDTVLQLLWHDDAGCGEWRVTTVDRLGKEREYEASIQCCNPDSLDKANTYECVSKISGPGRVVTGIGDIYAVSE